VRVVRGFSGLDLGLRSSAVTVGNFDGVHRGHQRVICSARRAAQDRGTASVVCTFDPHTRRVLRPAAAPVMLQTLSQRLHAIEALGVDVVVVIPFDLEVAATPHQRFVDDFLLGELAMASLHVSAGFSFGQDHAGSAATVERRARESGFEVIRVAPEIRHGEPVCSTRIRLALAAGDVALAAELLSRQHVVGGVVVAGAGRGREIGVPTANLALYSECVPAAGVYATWCRTREVRRPSVTNIGTRPTFGSGGDRVVETHLLEGNEDLYGKSIEIGFVRRIRGERRFDSAADLRRQIDSDIASARAELTQLPLAEA